MTVSTTPAEVVRVRGRSPATGIVNAVVNCSGPTKPVRRGSIAANLDSVLVENREKGWLTHNTKLNTAEPKNATEYITQ